MRGIDICVSGLTVFNLDGKPRPNESSSAISELDLGESELIYSVGKQSRVVVS
jgi:hypothetical protein